MSDAPIFIDPQKCKGCQKCVRECGFGALHMEGKLAVVDPSACKACFVCVKACPFHAISEVKQEIFGTRDIESYKNIWVFAEQNHGVIQDVSFELLAKARTLVKQRGEGCKLGAILLGNKITDEMCKSLIAGGADMVYKVDDPKLEDYEAEVYVDACAQLIQKYKPEVILAGATAVGRAFFARVAVKVRTGLTADCTQLKVEKTKNKDTGVMQMLLHQTRPAFGGNIMATIMTPNHRPQMATVRPKVFKKDKPDPKRSGEILAEALKLTAPKTNILKSFKNTDEANIAEAEILVAGGRGLKKAENLNMLFKLAKLLGGEVAVSRACVDAGWCTASRQVGQTGKTVCPKLYLAFGISGAIQHLAGMRASDTIIAVNSDPNAPIFSVADLGIVGDIFEILPALVDAIEKIKAK